MGVERYRILFIAGFLLLLIAPGISSLYRPDVKQSNIEKRYLKQYPPLPKTRESLKKYPADFEGYLNDQIGFRAHLLRINSLIKFTMGISINKNVIIGKERWLFRRPKTPDHQYAYNKDYKNTYLHHFKVKQQWLKSLGIDYYLMIMPNKSEIYPEYLPENFQFAKESRYDTLINALKRNEPQISTTHIKKRFLAEKNLHPYRLYFKNDHHINFWGAEIATNELMQNINLQYKAIKPIPINPLSYSIFQQKNYPHKNANISSFTWLGDSLSTLMGLPGYLPDENPIPDWYFNLECKAQYNTLRKYDSPNTDITWHCQNTQTSIKVVVLRDSFAKALMPFFSRHFEAVTYFWKNDADAESIKMLLEQEKPEIVIEEVYEPFLQNKLNQRKIMTETLKNLL